jgi:hypothetical protein
MNAIDIIDAHILPFFSGDASTGKVIEYQGLFSELKLL